MRAWVMVLAAACNQGALLAPPAGGDGGVVALPDLARPATVADLATTPFDFSVAVDAGPPGGGQFGDRCAANTDCASGLCLPMGRCSRGCNGPADCPKAPEWFCDIEAAPLPSCKCNPSSLLEACGVGHDYDCDGLIDDPPPMGDRKLVSSSILLPATRSDFAADLNGDGKVDNQMGNVFGALAAQNLDSQGQQDAFVASGQGLLLFDLRAGDPAFVTDACARLRVGQSVTTKPPDFTGHGTFAIDGRFPVDELAGALSGGSFQSLPVPAVALVPGRVTVQVAMLGSLVPLPLVGASVTLAQSAGTGHGQINGAVRAQDVQGVIIPALASGLDGVARRSPCDATCQQVRAIFDVGGCVNPDGTLAQAGDGRIATCEVGGNAIIQNVFASDVALFDARGQYHPDPTNAHPDSLSVGLGFSAVGASF